MRETNLLKRLEQQSFKLPNNGCWIWLGYTNPKGYGEIHFNKRTERVHRLSAHLFLGLDLEDKKQFANHKECLNKNCWNPEHLYVGTAQDNTNDSKKWGAMSNIKTHCKYGHELTNDNITLGSKGERNCKTCAQKRANDYYEWLKQYK
ncbi:MAG TPA: hypothetical protein VNX68_03020 [Nitrosopumilaceae archaeon]|jgi:hypothetical protein|nr:hypothetical protein [Nitrosopumilaceae archaeon]